MSTISGIKKGGSLLRGTPHPKPRKKPTLTINIPKGPFKPESEHHYDRAPEGPQTSSASLSTRVKRKSTPCPSPPSSDGGSPLSDSYSDHEETHFSPPPSPPSEHDDAPKFPAPAPTPRGSRDSDSHTLNGLEIDVSPVSEMRGSFATQGKFYNYVELVHWGHRKYKLTLEIPIIDESSLDEAKLKQAIKQYTEVFLKDLQEKNGAQESQIKPGTNFNILFTEDGYTAYVPKGSPKMSSDELTPEEIIGDSPCVVKGTDDVAKELSAIIQKGASDEIIQAVKTSSIIQTYLNRPLQKTTQSDTPKTAAEKSSLRIVKLRNLGATCYLNTAFQQLATNKVFREEILAHPGALVNDEKVCTDERAIELGKSHPLYVALKEYEDAQGSEEPKTIDLTALFKKLGYNDQTKQDDSQQARLDILSQIDFVKLAQRGSPLCSTSLSMWSHQDEKTKKEIWHIGSGESPGMAVRSVKARSGTPLKDLLLQQQIDYFDEPTRMKELNVWAYRKMEAFPNPPGILTVHIKQSDWDPKLFPKEKRVEFIDKLISRNLNDNQLNELFSDSKYYTLFKTNKLTPSQKETLAEYLLSFQEKTKYSKAVSYFEEPDRPAYYALVQPKQRIPVEAPILLDLPKELYREPNESTQYELMSFSCHQGERSNSGHYVAYIRDGENYWMQSDANDPIKLNEKQFIEAAKSAYELIYNKVGLKSGVAAAPKIAAEEKPAQSATAPAAPPAAIPPTPAKDVRSAVLTQDEQSVIDTTRHCIHLMRTARPIARVISLGTPQFNTSLALGIPTINTEKKLNLFLDELEAFSDEKNKPEDGTEDFPIKNEHTIYLNLPNDVAISEATQTRITEVLSAFKNGSKILTDEAQLKPQRVGFGSDPTGVDNPAELKQTRRMGFDEVPLSPPPGQSTNFLRKLWNGSFGQFF